MRTIACVAVGLLALSSGALADVSANASSPPTRTVVVDMPPAPTGLDMPFAGDAPPVTESRPPAPEEVIRTMTGSSSEVANEPTIPDAVLQKAFNALGQIVRMAVIEVVTAAAEARASADVSVQRGRAAGQRSANAAAAAVSEFVNAPEMRTMWTDMSSPPPPPPGDMHIMPCQHAPGPSTAPFPGMPDRVMMPPGDEGKPSDGVTAAPHVGV